MLSRAEIRSCISPLHCNLCNFEICNLCGFDVKICHNDAIENITLHLYEILLSNVCCELLKPWNTSFFFALLMLKVVWKGCLLFLGHFLNFSCTGSVIVISGLVNYDRTWQYSARNIRKSNQNCTEAGTSKLPVSRAEHVEYRKKVHEC